MLDGRVLEASQVENEPFGKTPLKREETGSDDGHFMALRGPVTLRHMRDDVSRLTEAVHRQVPQLRYARAERRGVERAADKVAQQ